VERAPPDAPGLRRILGEVAPRIRDALRAANRVGGIQADGPAVHALRRRMQGLARRKAQQRDLESLDALDRGLRMLMRGRTAGEEARLAAWLELPDREFVEKLRTLVPDEPPRAPVAVSLIGAILLGSGQPGWRRGDGDGGCEERADISEKGFHHPILVAVLP
jgi:hypothetical protein